MYLRIVLALVFMGVLIGGLGESQARSEKKRVDFERLLSLKIFMDDFIDDIVDIQIGLFDKKAPNWDLLTVKIKDLKDTAQKLKKTDNDRLYVKKIDELIKAIRKFDRLIQQRDSKIKQEIVGLTDACLNCHLAHRPIDIKKTNNKNKISKR
ncbi:hypothetical protein BVY03_03525 [bacterium K02(2017)]|nr:hypothetical protein BVY03_03525 [bacterium K02(2017)]